MTHYWSPKSPEEPTSPYSAEYHPQSFKCLFTDLKACQRQQLLDAEVTDISTTEANPTTRKLVELCRGLQAPFPDIGAIIDKVAGVAVELSAATSAAAMFANDGL